MKQKILNTFVAIMLVITLTMANFLFLCFNAVTYAVDEFGQIKSETNNKNVEFMAYFINENGKNVTNLSVKTDEQNAKLHFKISVPKEGYFNGKIVLGESNFKFKNNLSDGINKIEDNAIYLNQINAGESKDFDIGLELLEDQSFDLSMINKISKVSINGTYKDSTEKDITINSERDICLKLISPYENKNEDNILNQNIITNKVFEIDGKNKRVIQIMVQAGINNNLFPVKSLKLNINAPKMSNKYPETVFVNSYENLVTNGKNLSNDNWNYNSDNGTIAINIENTAEDNKVYWIKEGSENFVITYIYEDDSEVTTETSKISSEISLYDEENTVMHKTIEASIGADIKDNIVSSTIKQSEPQIYKGKLYEKIARDITYKDIIDINLNNVQDEIIVNEKNQTIADKEIDANYKNTIINKANLNNVLGNNAKLNIVNAQTNEVIATIDTNTEADENGTINVSYPESVKNVSFKIDGNVNIGRLEITNTKTINSVDTKTLKDAKSIDFENEVSYLYNNNVNTLSSTKSNIELLESETSVELELNRTEFTTASSNDNVEIRAILKSRDEKNELFKNPKILIELPAKMTSIQINSINLLYEDELKIKSSTLNGNIIEIDLEGEQTKYKSEAIDGAMIIINANIATDKLATNSAEQIKLTFSNEKAVNMANNGIVTKDISIISSSDLITSNNVKDLGIDVVNNAGNSTATLNVNQNEISTSVEKQVINNKSEEISNVQILGTFPTKEATTSNNIDAKVSNVTVNGVDASRVKTYYTENENADNNLSNTENKWTENITDSAKVKKYLVNVDKLAPTEGVETTYQVDIPSSLQYNQNAEEGYTTYYTDSNTTQKIDTQSISFATPGLLSNETANQVEENKDLTVNLKSVDDEDGEIKNGYGYRYVLNVKNNTQNAIKNINVEITPNENLKVTDIFYFDSDENTVESTDNKNITIKNLDPNETIEVAIYTVVDKQSNSNQIYLSAKCTANNQNFSSNKLVKEAEDSASIDFKVSSENSGKYVQSGDTIKYNISVKNTDKNVANSVKLDAYLPNEITLSSVKKVGNALSSDQYTITNDSSTGKQLLEIVEDQIEAGQEIDYEIETVVNTTMSNSKAKELASEFKLSADMIEIGDEKIQHILQADEFAGESTENGNNSNSGTSSNATNTGSGTINTNTQNTKYKNISGYVWVDANENGQKDNNEQGLSGIKVRLLNMTNNKFEKDSNGNEISTTTTETGFYNLSNVDSGKYIVIFEYDTTKYGLTTFAKTGVSSELNSKVITKTLKENNEIKTVAASSSIDVKDENISNINMGLVNAKKFDLKLDKYITKVTAKNNKTITNNYTDATLVKQEIDSKQINSTTFVAEYTIKVTNNGNVPGYAKKIADYLPKDFQFNSELNKDWYQSGNTLYCTSLSNVAIKPGESKEVKLILVKKMNENNTGLFNNSAEIVESYNEYGLKDINSVEGNKVKGEDDMGSADLIISIKTGQIVLTAVFTVIAVTALAVISIITYRKLNGRI